MPTTGAGSPKAYAEYTDGTSSGTPALPDGGVPLIVQGDALGADGFGGGSGLEACRCEGQGSQAGTADPVDAATGDNYSTATDLTVPGAGVPLAFTRTYDAQVAQTELSAGASPGPLGYGWSYNLGESLSYNSSSQVATVTEGNGAQDVFDAYSSSTSPSWCSGPTPNFCAASPRTIATLNQNTDESWTLVNNVNSQMTYDFNSSGVLTQITDAQGDSLTLSSGTPGSGWCPSASASCTVWTSSASGRSLTLAFNSSGQLTQVADPSDNVATFCFYTQSCASGAPGGGGQSTDLYSVTAPGSLTTTYTYDASNSSSTLQRDMLTMSPPGAGELQDTYNTSGQVTQQQNDASGQVTSFSYSTLNGGTTIVTTYPQGTSGPDQVDTYTYSSGVMLSDETTNSSSSLQTMEIVARDPVSLLPTDVEDPNQDISAASLDSYDLSNTHSTSTDGNVTVSSDAVGNTTQDAYNTFNQPWCTVDAANYANGVTCPSSTPSAPPAPGASDPDLGMTISYYNSSDQLTATTDPLGNTTTYAYTSGVSGVPNGLVYCSVDPVSYQAGVSCPTYAGSHVTGTTTHTFDSSGDTLTSTDADGNTTTSTYSSAHPGMVASNTDPDGTATTYTYNTAGQVTSQVVTFDSYTATTAYAYDSSGRKYCEVDPYEFALGVSCPTSPPSPSSPPAGVTSTFYDSNGRVIQTTNPIGGTTVMAYDDAGSKYCTVEPRAYAAGTRCPSSPPTTGTSGATIDIYDALEQLVQEISPIGGITLYSYDDAGNKIEQDVESNDSTHDPTVTTVYAYDADNRVISTTVDPGSSLAATTLQSYDPNGNVYCSVSANAYAAGSSAYQCPPWQPSWITSPPSPSSLYSSSSTSTQADNVTMTFSNANGNEVESTNPNVATTVSTFDGDGRTYCSADATNVATWLAAHPSGTYPYLCPTTPPSTAPNGTTTGYTTTIFDTAGRTLSSTDQVGDTTSYTYDPAGHRLTMVDPRGETTTSCYYWENATGQCAHSAPTGGGSGDDLYSQTTPVTSADPSGETTITTYYPGGKTDVTTTPAGSTTDAYDANGDLTSTTYSGTASGYSTPPNVSDTYNADGTQATMTDGTGTTTYAYDYVGDLTSQAFTAAGGTGLANNITSRSYFTTGVLDTVTYPSYGSYSSPTVTYAYDATGAMVSETDWLGSTVTFAHDADGNQTTQDNAVSTSNPSGTSSTSFSYDAADQNTQAASTLAQTCSGSTETLTQSFSGSGGSRNPNGQVTVDSESYTGSCSSPPSYQRNYSYDAAGRVVYQGVSAQGSSPPTFAYDGAGDLTRISSHDSNGSFDTYTQSYDYAGEVTGQTPVSGSSGVSSTYAYDTLGAQTQAVAGSLTSTYGFNQLGQMASYTSPVSTTTSYAYGGQGLEASASTTTMGWSAPVPVDLAVSLNSVSCTSSTFCVGVDQTGDVVTYNGTSWSAPRNVDTNRVFTGVSCFSSSFCAAVDSSGYVVTYNGSTWATPKHIDGTRALSAISCPPTGSGSCVAVDRAGYEVTYDGTWKTPKDIDGTRVLDSVSCSDTGIFQTCAAVDTSGYVVPYSSSTWGSPASVDPGKALTSVSCTSYLFCAAVDNAGNVLTFNGSTWSSPASIDGTPIDGISCTTSSSLFCAAVDNAGNALTYNGSVWGSPASIDGSAVLTGVSCPSTSFCAAVDASGDAVTYNPSTWVPPVHVDGSVALSAVTCPTSTFCVGVDTAGDVVTYNGTSWSAPQNVDSSRPLQAVSCYSTSFCAAVDSSGYVVTYNGSSWATPKDIDSTRALSAISCPPSGSYTCVAVDRSGYEVTYDGTWKTPKDIDGTRALDSVSCYATGVFQTCAAVDTSGYGVNYSSSTWGTPTSIDSSRALRAVSCWYVGTCVAVDNSGNVLSSSGGSWASPTTIDGSNAINAISCASSSFCVAVDNSGNALTYNGSVWSAAKDIDGTTALDSVSCVSGASFCVASDASGNVVTYEATTTLAQYVWNTTGSLATLLADGTNDYIYGSGDTPVEQVNITSSPPASNPQFMTYTDSDSSWLMTNMSGDETAFWRYDAFGNLAFGTPGSPFGYAGQYQDSSSNSTGFDNMRARWYDPQTGSFTTRDPAFNQTDESYVYAEDDPVNGTDPNGDNVCQVIVPPPFHTSSIFDDHVRDEVVGGGEVQCTDLSDGVESTLVESVLLFSNRQYGVADSWGFLGPPAEYDHGVPTWLVGTIAVVRLQRRAKTRVWRVRETVTFPGGFGWTPEQLVLTSNKAKLPWYPIA